MNTTYTFSDDLISDLHKDAYGFRPGEGFWQRWAEATDAEKQEEWDWLVQAMAANMRAEQEDQERAILIFEKRIRDLIDLGARNRAMAIRWLDEAYETQGDMEFLEYNLDLPFGYFKKNP